MIISSASPADLINRAFLDASAPLKDCELADPRFTEGEIASFRIAIDGAVLAGISAFGLISAHDAAWHAAVFRGDIEHDEAVEQAILGRYRSWSLGCHGLLSAIGLLEGLGLPVEAAQTLRFQHREALALLTPDGDFFEGEGLDDLASDAVAAHDRDETVEFLEMGD